MSRETKSFLKLLGGISIPLSEIKIKAIQSQGPGGQNVNKVATAIQLSFDVSASSLPEPAKRRLLNSMDHRMTKEGALIIRSQEANRQTALRKLAEALRSSLVSPKRRWPTRPTKASKEKRLRSKTIRSRAKSLRGRVRGE